MDYFTKSRFSQQLASGPALLLDTASIEQVARAAWNNTRPSVTPDNGLQLLHWIECLPQDILDAHPRFGILYIHALLFTQQHERARHYLQALEHNLRCGEYSETESLQAEITTLRTYLTMQQEFTSRYQETFHDLARFVMNTMVKPEYSPKQAPDHVMPHEPLSKRELEVLDCIAAGMSNQEIAQSIIVTVGTVKRHLNNIYSKLNVHSRMQAVRYAQQHNLL